MELFNSLKENSYPGRGIIIGRYGDSAVCAYFIMGRSTNSRNRIFEETQDGIRTKAFDESKLTDPSLIIYAPVRKIENSLIITNGDQTDTIYEFIEKGSSFEEALRTRTFEPDAPNFTPRISGILNFDNGFSYKLSILKSQNGDQDLARRYFFEYEGEKSGIGHFIHTYKCDGNPRIPSFEGEPSEISIEDSIDEFTEKLWDSLNQDNKVSLFVRYINIKDGSSETRIVNKNK